MYETAYNQIKEQIGAGNESAAIFGECQWKIRRLMQDGYRGKDRTALVKTERGSAWCEVYADDSVEITILNNTLKGFYNGSNRNTSQNNGLLGHNGVGGGRGGNRAVPVNVGPVQYNGSSSSAFTQGTAANLGRNLDVSVKSQARKTEITSETTNDGGFSLSTTPLDVPAGFSREDRAKVTEYAKDLRNRQKMRDEAEEAYRENYNMYERMFEDIDEADDRAARQIYDTQREINKLQRKIDKLEDKAARLTENNLDQRAAYDRDIGFLQKQIRDIKRADAEKFNESIRGLKLEKQIELREQREDMKARLERDKTTSKILR